MSIAKVLMCDSCGILFDDLGEVSSQLSSEELRRTARQRKRWRTSVSVGWPVDLAGGNGPSDFCRPCADKKLADKAANRKR